MSPAKLTIKKKYKKPDTQTNGGNHYPRIAILEFDRIKILFFLFISNVQKLYFSHSFLKISTLRTSRGQVFHNRSHAQWKLTKKNTLWRTMTRVLTVVSSFDRNFTSAIGENEFYSRTFRITCEYNQTTKAAKQVLFPHWYPDTLHCWKWRQNSDALNLKSFNETKIIMRLKFLYTK